MNQSAGRISGCQGCVLAAIALVVLGAILSVALGVSIHSAGQKPAEPTHDSLTVDLPAATAGGADDALASSAPEAPVALGAGRLFIDFKAGELEVVPGPVGSSLTVDAHYDKARFELEQSGSRNEDGSWEHTIRFGPKGSILFSGSIEKGDNKVRITVPAGVTLALEARIRMGESRLDLSDLALTEANLELEMGDHSVRFDRPTTVPMTWFRIDGSMGEVELVGLGWASPSEVDLEHSMGELDVDLSGPWRGDVVVRAEQQMGELRIGIPDEVRLVDHSRAKLGEHTAESRPPAPDGAPVLTLESSVTMGEARVYRTTAHE